MDEPFPKLEPIIFKDPFEDSDEEVPRSEKRTGRRKIKIEYIDDKSRRHITFSKRKAGIMKKAYELSTLTGTQVLLLVASETGHVYTFATPKLQPLITKPEGKNLIQACLNAPDGNEANSPVMNTTGAFESEPSSHQEFEERKIQFSQSNSQYPIPTISYGGQQYLNQVPSTLGGFVGGQFSQFNQFANQTKYAPQTYWAQAAANVLDNNDQQG